MLGSVMLPLACGQCTDGLLIAKVPFVWRLKAAYKAYVVSVGAEAAVERFPQLPVELGWNR